MSAMGSVMVIAAPSPTCLRHARNLTCVHHLTQADAAQAELAVHRVRSATATAAGVCPHLELRLALGLLDECLLRHELLLSFASEREAEGIEQGAALGIGTGGRD